MGHMHISGTEPSYDCWHYICLSYSFEAGSGNQAYRSRVGLILSVVSVVVSGIGQGLVVQSGEW